MTFNTGDRSYTSKELFHLVGHSHPLDDEANFGRLTQVLTSRCVSHAPHDGSWGATSYTVDWQAALDAEKLVVPTVTCYADIPFESLALHIKKYGKFGLSFPRPLLARYGARPVIYVPMAADDYLSPFGGALLKNVEAITKGFEKQCRGENTRKSVRSKGVGSEPDSPEAAIDAMRTMVAKDFLAFIKPFNSDLPEDHQDNYYMEREWRKYGNLKFAAQEVARVVVAEGFEARLLECFPEYEGKVCEL